MQSQTVFLELIWQDLKHPFRLLLVLPCNLLRLTLYSVMSSMQTRELRAPLVNFPYAKRGNMRTIRSMASAARNSSRRKIRVRRSMPLPPAARFEDMERSFSTVPEIPRETVEDEESLTQEDE